jgi:hypothetical protein
MVMKVVAAPCIVEFSKVVIVDTSFPLQARLQQVNHAWRDCVGNTLEWAALDMVQDLVESELELYKLFL